MAYKNEMSDSMEQLLETLIRMTGSTNQTIDNLQKRVSQLECLIKEQHFPYRKEMILTRAPKN